MCLCLFIQNEECVLNILYIQYISEITKRKTKIIKHLKYSKNVCLNKNFSFESEKNLNQYFKNYETY